MELLHEQTIVYARILRLLELTAEIINKLPAGWGFLADQLRRSTCSVALNYAEGHGQRSSKQVQRFFGYAIQSARETSMAFDAAATFRMGTDRGCSSGEVTLRGDREADVEAREV